MTRKQFLASLAAMVSGFAWWRKPKEPEVLTNKGNAGTVTYGKWVDLKNYENTRIWFNGREITNTINFGELT